MTPQQRAEILQVYVTLGFTAAAPLAVQYGVSPKTMSRWARKAGHKGKRGREAGVWKAKVNQAAHDRRWQWAIERGEVRV